MRSGRSYRLAISEKQEAPISTDFINIQLGSCMTIHYVILEVNNCMENRKQRRFDIDWLRIIAVLLLIPFHAALIFVMDPNSIMYVKDSVNSPFLDMMASVIHQFHMPLLFLLSGMASCLALSFRSAGQYLTERVTKLLVPGVFGLMTLIPVTTFLTQLSKGRTVSFIDHYIGFFKLDGNDLAGYSGTLTPAHLWFIFFLFIFSLIGLPLFLYLRKPLEKRQGKLFEKPFMLLLFGIPLTLASGVDILGDKNPLVYFLFFFYGFIFMTGEGYQKAIDRDWKYYLPLAILFELLRHVLPNYPDGTVLWATRGLMECTNRLIMVLVLLGFAHHFINRGSKVQKYLSEAAFPFYLLHMTVTTVVGLFIIRIPTGIAVKYLMIITIATLLTFLLYELLKRFGWTRFLLGMKPLKKKCVDAAAEADETSSAKHQTF